MSAITIENDLVHYEVLGRGRPVILLHGWLGSWRYWIPAMQKLSGKYRTYALDLWGFGDSGKDSRQYNFAAQVKLLHEFMEKMGIAKAALIGHDLGAAICVRYAVQHPDRVPRLMMVAPPLFRMAPPSSPLTANPPPPERQLPATPATIPPTTGAKPPEGDKPASPPAAGATRAAPSSDAKPASPATPPPAGKPAVPADVQPEAETMPLRTDEMRARIQAAIQPPAAGVIETPKPKAGAPGGQTPNEAATKSPRDAATPPTDQPETEIKEGGALPALPDLPAMPKVDYEPDARQIQVQQANPVKDHLGVLDALMLLEKHVDAGADRDKLKVEVAKTDKIAVAVTVESLAGVDTLREMQRLRMPSVTVYGKGDTFLPPPDDELIADLRAGGGPLHLIGMDDTRHFPMLEKIDPFTRLLMDFLEIEDVSKLEIKKTWERRVR